MSIKIEDFKFASSSVDDFFQERKPEPIVASTERRRVRIASLTQLAGFQPVSQDKLVRLSKRDFWRLDQDDDGYFIERLVDDEPVEW